MNKETKNIEQTGSQEQLTTYGQIAISVFIIIAGLSYLIPSILPKTASYFPDGTNFITAGVLIILVNILNTFKGIKYDLFLMILGSVSLVVGINKVLALEMSFLPLLFVILGFSSLISNIKRSNG